MNHGKKGKKFGRETKQRKALMKSLAFSLINNGKITTTLAKAKTLRPYMEKLVTKSKADTVQVARYLSSVLPGPSVTKLLKQISPKYRGSAGGYTRIRKLAPRASDGAQMAIIEFI